MCYCSQVFMTGLLKPSITIVISKKKYDTDVVKIVSLTHDEIISVTNIRSIRLMKTT